MDIKEPTAEQCSTNAKVFENETKIAYAIWYPQMGGYAGKAVAIFDKQWTVYRNGAAQGGCIDVLVWHDGEFPFGENDGNPREIHHCDPDQFIEFGKALSEINERRCTELCCREAVSKSDFGGNMETREAVARAICVACEDRPDALGDARGNDKRWQDYAEAADAAMAAMAGCGVLVRLDRPEGYDDVHPQLVAEDAIKETWPSYETLMPNDGG